MLESLDRSENFFLASQKARRQLSEIVAMVVGISFAIDVLSSVALDLGGWKIAAFVSISIVSACGLYAVKTRTEHRRYALKVSAAFVWKRRGGAVQEIPEYYFGEQFAKTAKAVFAENPALKTQWEHRRPEEELLVNGRYVYRPDQWVRLAIEISEYILLHRLSTHLSGYFNQPQFDQSRIESFSRNQLPDVLLNNRVLEIISRDMRDRPGFEEPEVPRGWDQIIMASSREGGLYSHFEIQLPKGSMLSRDRKGSLIIDGPIIRLEIRTSCRGMSSLLPFLFIKHVMGEDYGNVDIKQVLFSIEAYIKRPLRTTRDTWQYYAWVESFLQKVKREFDLLAYLEGISWPSLEILLHALKENRN